MLDTIYIGMSGLTGYAKGLRVIGNNLTNVNTPGFKSSQLQFADFFYQGQASQGQGSYSQGASSSSPQLGSGLRTMGTSINFKPGDMQQTGNDLDLAINGDGYFVMHDGNQSRYTRSGQFQFDKDGFLVSKSSGLRVSAFDENGQITDVSLSGMRTNPPKATETVSFSGILSSTATTDVTINGIKVIDADGGEHLLKMELKNNASVTPGEWLVTLSDAAGVVGTGSIMFKDGVPMNGNNKLTFSYAPAGGSAFSFTTDFSKDVTSSANGGTSTLAVSSQNGYGAGALSKVTFDADGKMQTTYSNGQTVKGVRLALARFESEQDVIQLGGNEVTSMNMSAVKIGYANSGSFGKLDSGVLEGSNVDMAQEFSNLIVMQRGYQASSHVISTANDMIQQLFDMKGHR